MAKSRAYTVRISEEGRRIIEGSVARGDFTRAELLRQAFWHYVSTNPDGVLSYPAVERGFAESSSSDSKSATASHPVSRTDTGSSVTQTENPEPSGRDTRSPVSEAEVLLDSVYGPLAEGDGR
jgi:hypothetical protein